MSVTHSLPRTAVPSRETLHTLREERIARARTEIESAMIDENRTWQTFDEMRRLCPTPPPGAPDRPGECSSVTSISSDDEAEDIISDSDCNGSTSKANCAVVHRKRWVIKSPVINWAETRRAHMNVCFLVLCDNRFMYHDEVYAADQRVMKCLLHVVAHEEHWAYKGYMASPAFWACVFVMQSYSLRSEGYEVRSKSQDVLDHATEAWTLDNMHRVLAGDKSKTFKDNQQSDEYMTSVPTGQRGITRVVTRGNIKLRKLGVHDLGKGHDVRVKKMATLLELMEKAGVERPHERICNMQPPTTHKLKPSNSAREKAMARIEDVWDTNEFSRKRSFLDSRAAMLGPSRAVKSKRCASPISAYWHPGNRDDGEDIVDIGDGTFALSAPKGRVHADDNDEATNLGPVTLPSDDEEDQRGERDNAISRLLAQKPCEETLTLLKPTGASTADTRAPSPIRMRPLDYSTPPDHAARKAAKRSRKETATSTAVDPEVEAMRKQMAEIAEKLAAREAEVAAGRDIVSATPCSGSDSSELSSSEDEDHAIAMPGPREETGERDGSGGSGGSDDDLAFIKANQQQEAASSHERAVFDAAETAKFDTQKLNQLERSDKARQHQKAINAGKSNVALSKEELRLLEWRECLDPNLLQQGIIQKIRKKRVTPFHIQMRRRQEEAEKQKRRNDRRAMKDARAELKHLQAVERAENKEETRKRIEQEIAAKAERRRLRDQQRVGRANMKLNDAIKRSVAAAKAKKERQQQRAQTKLANAQKYGRSTIVHFGGDGEDDCTKLTLFVAPPKPAKQIAPSRLPRRNGYAVCEMSCEQHERLDKYGVSTPLEQADPYKRVTLDLEPASNGIRSTRGAMAVKLRAERVAEEKHGREE